MSLGAGTSHCSALADRAPDPQSQGREHRVSNLTLACESCNSKKGTKTATEFGHPELEIQAKQPLKDAAAMNTIRWVLYERLKATGLPVETGTGGRTKWNRTVRQLPKTHWLDATCVGASTPEAVHINGVIPLLITATGWQRRQMCLMDDHGFPRTGPKQQSRVKGFRTGDMVRAVVTEGTKVGTYWGKVSIKARGYFTITTPAGAVPDISYRFCLILQHADGYRYAKGGRDFLSPP